MGGSGGIGREGQHWHFGYIQEALVVFVYSTNDDMSIAASVKLVSNFLSKGGFQKHLQSFFTMPLLRSFTCNLAIKFWGWVGANGCENLPINLGY